MSSLSDIVGGADLYNGVSYSFTTDRFGNANSAIYLNNGYLQVPPGVYFSGDFTVTAWINLKSYEYYSRIFDFNSYGSSDAIVLSMEGTSSSIIAYIENSNVRAQESIQLNKWYYVAFVLSGTTGFIFVNGNLINSGSLYAAKNVIRNSN